MLLEAERKLPPWLKTRLPSGEKYNQIKAKSRELGLSTVCEEARCPNIGECWSGGTATYMVMGDTCTRGCRFCSVSTQKAPPAPDPLEPYKLADTIHGMDLEYVVVTTVCRDDLADQGASHLEACVHAILKKNPGLKLEILIQDFRGDLALIDQVARAGAHVVAHNVETVLRLTHPVRDAKAGYRQSLDVLARAKQAGVYTKSSIMLGLGESAEELSAAMKDLRAVDCDFLTLGQYLRPTGSGQHLPVSEFVTPERFRTLKEEAESLGFLYVASGPFVRSSYRAGELFIKNILEDRHA